MPTSLLNNRTFMGIFLGMLILFVVGLLFKREKFQESGECFSKCHNDCAHHKDHKKKRHCEHARHRCLEDCEFNKAQRACRLAFANASENELHNCMLPIIDTYCKSDCSHHHSVLSRQSCEESCMGYQKSRPVTISHMDPTPPR